MARQIWRSLSGRASFWVCLLTTIGLFIGSACVPPYFVVDKSMFECAGFLLSFATLGIASDCILKGLDVKIRNGNTEVCIGNHQDKNKEENNDGTDEQEYDDGPHRPCVEEG